MKDSVKKKPQSKTKAKTTYLHAVFFLAATCGIAIILIVFFVGKFMNVPYNSLSVKTISPAPYPNREIVSDPNLSAQAALVYERNSRVKVYEKNSTTRFTPASTAKIMTALVALETYTPNAILTANNIDGVVGSTMGLEEGEKMRAKDLLYGLMLPSGNDAAYTLASNYPDGGYSGFVARMNSKAKELGLYNTRYLDPSGYEDGNYTTPQDMAHLADVALKNPLFQEVVHTKRITVTDITKNISHDLENLNKLLDYSDVYGIKTGFTNEAGQVLVTSINSNGGEYIIVVMKSEDRFRDTQKIMAQIIRNIELKSF